MVTVSGAGDGLTDTLQCTSHPLKTSASPVSHGICAVCLQDKLSKLASSSFTSDRPSSTYDTAAALVLKRSNSMATPRRRGFWSFLHKKTSAASSSVPAVDEAMSFERKVTRSKSVGCGTKSLSGDLFDRIRTLRRVESQRHCTGGGMPEKVRCGRFMMITSSSSASSSSSSYGKSKSWGWAFPSPRRAFVGGRREIRNGESRTIFASTAAAATTTNAS